MRFLYGNGSLHLEKLCDCWHLTAHTAGTLKTACTLDARQFGTRRHVIWFNLATFIRSTAMLDVLLLALGLGFFVISVGYVYACDRL